MNTKYTPPTQAPAQDVAPGAWHPISSAPVGNAAACIDVWDGDFDHRFTDCFWDAQVKGWCYEFLDERTGGYRAAQVKNPTHWMPSPARPK